MYLLFPEMSQLSTEDDSLDYGRSGAGREGAVRPGRSVLLSVRRDEAGPAGVSVPKEEPLGESAGTGRGVGEPTAGGRGLGEPGDPFSGERSPGTKRLDGRRSREGRVLCSLATKRDGTEAPPFPRKLREAVGQA